MKDQFASRSSLEPRGCGIFLNAEANSNFFKSTHLNQSLEEVNTPFPVIHYVGHLDKRPELTFSEVGSWPNSAHDNDETSEAKRTTAESQTAAERCCLSPSAAYFCSSRIPPVGIIRSLRRLSRIARGCFWVGENAHLSHPRQLFADLRDIAGHSGDAETSGAPQMHYGYNAERVSDVVAASHGAPPSGSPT